MAGTRESVSGSIDTEYAPACKGRESPSTTVARLLCMRDSSVPYMPLSRTGIRGSGSARTSV